MQFHWTEKVEDPTQRVMDYGFPLNVVGMMLPEILRKPLSHQVYNMRTVELPFLFNNIPVPARKGDRVLDFGCCESRNALHLASVGYHVTGVDYQEDYPFHHNNIIFYRGDFTRATENIYNIDSLGIYDYIIAISSIEHSGLPAYGNTRLSMHAPRKIMEIFNRYIKQSGKLILTVPYGDKFEVTDFERTYDDKELHSLMDGLFDIHKLEIFDQTSPNTWKVACVVATPLNENERYAHHYADEP